MNTRERNLIIGLGGSALLFVAYSYVLPAFTQPIAERRDKIAQLNGAIETDNTAIMQLLKDRKQLGQWKAISLPADPPNTKRPDALNAQRLYLNWLAGLAEKSQLKGVRTSPERRQTKPNLYISVSVSLTGEGTAAQVADFLARIELSPLLHRVNRVRIESTELTGNPPFKIDIELEGIVFPETKPRNTLFPETTLKTALTANAKELTVADPLAIRVPTPFDVLLGTERVAVTAVNTTTGVWTIEREAFAMAHSAGTSVQIPPGPPTPVLLAKANEIQSHWRFLKPVPPAKYDPRIETKGEAVLLTGTPIKQGLELKGTAGTNPMIRMSGTWPEGLSYDPQSKAIVGQLPRREAGDASRPNELKLGFDVIAEGDDYPTVERTMRFTIKDPNTAPEIAPLPKIPVAVAGRMWKLQPQAKDKETPREKLRWSAVSLIEGMILDPATGKVEWTPPAAVEPGTKSIELRVADDSSPALAANQVYSFELVDDLPQFTFLIAIIEGTPSGTLAPSAINATVSVTGETPTGSSPATGEPKPTTGSEVWFFDRIQNRKLVVLPGVPQQVGDLDFIIDEVGPQHVVLLIDGQRQRLEIGKSLRQMTPLETK